MSIPPCTTGKHSTVDDTPQPATKAESKQEPDIAAPRAVPRLPIAQAAPSQSSKPATPQPPVESEDDEPSLEIPNGTTCRRKACNATYNGEARSDSEACVHHPGVPIFHEGSKGYSCCKKRVLDFDDFMRLEGCNKKPRHLFIGSGKKNGLGGTNGASAEEKITTPPRSDFYQTPTNVIASIFLKKIDKEKSKVTFPDGGAEVALDLHTSDGKWYEDRLQLYGTIDPGKSSFKIMGTKLELELAKSDGAGWPVLRKDDPHTGEIIQSGRAGRV